MHDNKQLFLKGTYDGLPVALGYLAVSFTLGIAAKKAGLTPIQAMIMSLANNASASEFSAMGLISSGAGYLEIAFTTLILNLRYILMSCALSQKLDPKTVLSQRFLMAYDVTDEIFGISVAVDGKLNPFYTYGLIAVALPCWSIGTYLGTVTGSILPNSIISAMNVALYGMFIAVIIPPAKKNKVIALLIVISMAAGSLFAYLPGLKEISSGAALIILTVVISFAAAVIFPVEEKKEVARCEV
ncbi:hypothetical protein SDC9_112160 [bioreactor metagenome]|uniref:Inner membrane protein YgaZ n=1 Tax=bioreactor metagenome TaxID=1076179 RepID=A0A645BIQ0_9ZZZZ|nr:AzlC family ABC transporter permease [Candidatus Metalachnospira sp.]